MSGDNKVDETILRYADSRSAEDISAMLGGLISPVQVATRRKFLLTSRNPLDQAEEEQLALYKLRDLLAQMEEKYLDFDNAKIQLSMLKVLFDRIDKRKAANEMQLNQLYSNQAQIMFDAIRLAFAAMMEHLSVDETEARAALAAALPQAVLTISESNSGEDIEP